MDNNRLEELAKHGFKLYDKALYDTVRKLRRSWKYIDYVRIGNILTNAETFKNQSCYEDLFVKYGLKNVIEKYWNKYLKHNKTLKLTDEMMREILVYPTWLLDKLEE